MIAADVIGPWWDIETTVTDSETGQTQAFRDQRRAPQFLHDIADNIAWQDVTAQLAEEIPPNPAVCVWRVWIDEATLAKFDAHDSYVVLRKGVVDEQFQTPIGW